MRFVIILCERIFCVMSVPVHARSIEACCTSNYANQWPEGTVGWKYNTGKRGIRYLKTRKIQVGHSRNCTSPNFPIVFSQAKK
jgi:hypothetical protein